MPARAGVSAPPQDRRRAQLYFFKKVCQPTDEQYASARQAAFDEAHQLARDYARMARNGGEFSTWPVAWERLADKLADEMRSQLPEETSQRYAAEIAARKQAKQIARQRMTIRAFDARATLLPEQYEPLREALAQDWGDRRGQSLQHFLYDEYLRLEIGDAAREVLSDEQERILSQENRNGTISFGWEQDMELQDWSGDDSELAGLEKFNGMKVSNSPPGEPAAGGTPEAGEVPVEFPTVDVEAAAVGAAGEVIEVTVEAVEVAPAQPATEVPE
ncbi:MAG: hypothetical protein R3B90_20840 [Planctomycetaceae bacterium]